MLSGERVTVLASRPIRLYRAQNRSMIVIRNTSATKRVDFGGSRPEIGASTLFGLGFALPAAAETWTRLEHGDELWGQADPDDSLANNDSTFTFDDSAATFVDLTTEANNDTVNNVPLPEPFDTDDYLIIGADDQFAGLEIVLGTSGDGADPQGETIWEYFDGTSWVELPLLAEPTLALTVAAGTYRILFTPPADWAETTVNSEERFFVRLRATEDDVYDVTTPLITRIKVLSETQGAVDVGVLAVDSLGRR